jgi:hypothetical protein
MASKRDLKKDIDLLMSLVLNDCFYVAEYNAKVDQDAVMEIAADIVRKHREFRKRANHPDGKDNPKLVKEYYKNLNAELLAAADEALEKLSAEVKKVA